MIVMVPVLVLVMVAVIVIVQLNVIVVPIVIVILIVMVIVKVRVTVIEQWQRSWLQQLPEVTAKAARAARGGRRQRVKTKFCRCTAASAPSPPTDTSANYTAACKLHLSTLHPGTSAIGLHGLQPAWLLAATLEPYSLQLHCCLLSARRNYTAAQTA